MKKYLLALALCCALQPATARDVAAHIVPGSCMRPSWPPASLRALETGTSTVGFMVAEDGALLDIRIIGSSGFPDLDRASIESVSRCKFNAATEDGKPVAAWGRIQHRWTLANTGMREPELAAMERRARQGSAKDQLALGNLYLSGRTGKRNIESGPDWLRRAADQGLADAQVALALTMMPASQVGEVPAESVALLRKAAAQNHATARFLLARIFIEGGHPDEGQPLLDQAVEQQYAPAMSLAGTQLLDSGRQEDLPRAITLLQQAATKGDHNAHWMLAECYAMGRGVARSDEVAVTHLQQAALGPIAPAQQALALAYETGTGVKQDATLAKLWRDAAVATGKGRTAASNAN